MSELERELKEALRRTDPPAGFEERVMRRVGAERGAGLLEFPGRNRSRGRLAAAALLLLAIGAGTWGGARWEQRRRGERAAEQVIAALGIASEKVNLAKDRIEHRSAR